MSPLVVKFVSVGVRVLAVLGMIQVRRPSTNFLPRDSRSLDRSIRRRSTGMTVAFQLTLLIVFGLDPFFVQADDKLRFDARAALLKSTEFFRSRVAVEGGYVFRYSPDLKLREGEEKTGPMQVWIEPPSTPAVGMAYLEAYRASGEKLLLQAAQETASCLIRGQLHSGGWSNDIQFDPEQRKLNAYRVDGPAKPKARNITTLDDNKSQACVRFLAELDRELEFGDRRVHEATLYALDALMKFQYPNGAWPQRFSTEIDPKDFPVVPAAYPKTWSREFPKEDYTGYYTLNDNTHVDTLRLMLTAHEVYRDERYLKSAIKGGEFLLLAQMPDPQPAWAQQYNSRMEPSWARKFEPPAISGGESQKVIETLIYLYQETGDQRFYDSAKKAYDWLTTVVLPAGGLARFYELGTNRPLYFTTDYVLTYKDDDLPTHYGFIVKNGLAKLDERLRKFANLKGSELREYTERQHKPKKIEIPSEKAVREVIQNLDERGAWVESGKLSTYKGENLPTKVITSQTFIKNIDVLSRFTASRN